MVYPKSLAGRLAMLRRARRADVVVLQKKLPSPVEAVLLRQCARRLVFDFDDAIYCKHEGGGQVASRSRERKTNGILRRSDLVIAGNEILKRYAEPHCPRVRVIPSCVAVSGIPVQSHAPHEGPLVIGWVGGRINLGHLQGVAPVLQRLARRHDIVLHVVCDAGVDMPGAPVVHVPWKLETEAAEVARFDIGIMPLPASRHAEGKCGYKAIQCMAAGVPVVVSDVGINREVVEHGRQGFVATDAEAFERHLETLIEQPEQRAAMGRAGRAKAAERYSVEHGSRLLAAALKEAMA